MRLLLINEVCGTGSTGKICAGIAEEYEACGYEVKIAYGRDGYVPEKYCKYAVRIGNDLDVKLHALGTRITDRHGLFSTSATKSFLKWADEFNPDEVWLHNIHGYYINYKLLFAWIKSRPQMHVKWTLHDCWAFTGHCSHFTYVHCNRWKTSCYRCPQSDRYPKSMLFDNSNKNFSAKKAAFCGVQDMTIITPSKWLADLVKQSFLGGYHVDVMYNTIDKSVFKPTPSDFKLRNKISDKLMVLGVANVWEERKGLLDFIRLRSLLPDEYVIVLVGVNEGQMATLPDGFLCIKRTNNQNELAEIYSAADIYVSLSYEETFGMTVVESLLCGTRALVYEGTACAEVVEMMDMGGTIVPMDVNYMARAILNKVKR